jgi:large subunit ribosomal protein L9
MTELAKSLGKMTLTITVKAGEDGKLFGSVTNGTIADELKKQFEVTLDKRKIHIEKPIKAIGEHEIEMRLHTGVHTTLKLIVNSSNPLPAPEVSVHAGPETEKRGKSRRVEGKDEATAPAAEAKPERKGKTAKA